MLEFLASPDTWRCLAGVLLLFASRDVDRGAGIAGAYAELASFAREEGERAPRWVRWPISCALFVAGFHFLRAGLC